MYSQSMYKTDPQRKLHEAEIDAGAVLYRLTSIHYCQASEILNGKAPTYSKISGRFNEPDQLTTYCANNVIVCLAEVLYHMYRAVLDRIRLKRPYADVIGAVHWKKCLSVFAVGRIAQLVYIDSEGTSRDYDSRISGATITFPDPLYEPFRDFHTRVRQERKSGILYPSARHSQGLCIALFGDMTDRLQHDFYELLPVDLRLVSEDQDPAQAPRDCDPFRDKLHATMGYYTFTAPDQFERVRNGGSIYPADIPPTGMVDFVRRRYLNYPRDAVIGQRNP